MREPADNPSSSTNPSFAGLLTALTAARSRNEAAVKAGEAKLSSLKNARSLSIWKNEPEEDESSQFLEDQSTTFDAAPESYENYEHAVTTLSYENALKANARYKPIGPIEWDLSLPFDESQAAQAATNPANEAPAPRIQWDLSQPFEEPVVPKSFPQTPAGRAIAEILAPIAEIQLEPVKQTESKPVNTAVSAQNTVVETKAECKAEIKRGKKAKSKAQIESGAKPTTARGSKAKSKSDNGSDKTSGSKTKAKPVTTPARKPVSSGKTKNAVAPENKHDKREIRQDARQVREAAAAIQEPAAVSIPAFVAAPVRLADPVPVPVAVAVPVAAPTAAPTSVPFAAPVSLPVAAPIAAPVAAQVAYPPAAPIAPIATPYPVAAPFSAAVEKAPWERTSVTVYLTEAEYKQLQRRAGEAGMSAAEYMRSCTMEAEVLRAQVKKALAQMRAEKPRETTVPADVQAPVAQLTAEANSASRGSWRGWLAGLVGAIAIWSVRSANGH